MPQLPSEPFATYLEDHENRTLVRLCGELDFACVDDVAAVLDQARARGRDIEIDLSAITFLDSSGLQALIAARRRADRDHEVVVVGEMSDAARRILELTHTLDWLCERNGSG